MRVYLYFLTLGDPGIDSRNEMLTEAKSTNARLAEKMGGLRHKFFPN